MNDEEIKKYKKAGEIAKNVREGSKKLIKDGAKILDITEKIESEIIKAGGKFAFPTNISVNSIAAHSTPKIDDGGLLKKGDLVKIDLGVHVDGFIADTAYTIEVGTNDWEELINASKNALKEVVKVIKPGISISEIGKIIEDTIQSYNFVPIANLSGHEVGEYDLHAGLSIPNFDNKSTVELKEGMAVAIEPFATNGLGRVINTKGSEIFRLVNVKPVRQPIARKILEYVVVEHKELPFCKRWIGKNVGAFGIEMGMRELVRSGILHQYPILKEEKEGMVSQSEHTILILDKPIITTL